ncbi:TRAP transporter small permease [Nitrospirillum sp. BR 11164]|uniref:TRAP transporter small permease n=1 Tax=Nitrospirillum sp. BR 11164 TaxID=3104324 RepID=UPI002AFE1F49|nr:TRAP transporter small permease [Nitrospirillum sp. BR 11164]MEA1650781.1 TRAP transporter small permease [Nitrospirillum sp. BR 11164]
MHATHATAAPGGLAGMILTGLSHAATVLAAIGMVGMSLAEGWQVFARYVLNDSPGWTEPLTLLFMTTTALMGAAVAVRREMHFRFIALAQVAPPRVQAILNAFSRLVVLAIGAALAIWGWDLMADNWSIAMPGTELPEGLNYLPLSLGGALIALFAAERLVVPLPTPDHIVVED